MARHTKIFTGPSTTQRRHCWSTSLPLFRKQRSTPAEAAKEIHQISRRPYIPSSVAADTGLQSAKYSGPLATFMRQILQSMVNVFSCLGRSGVCPFLVRQKLGILQSSLLPSCVLIAKQRGMLRVHCGFVLHSATVPIVLLAPTLSTIWSRVA